MAAPPPQTAGAAAPRAWMPAVAAGGRLRRRPTAPWRSGPAASVTAGGWAPTARGAAWAAPRAVRSRPGLTARGGGRVWRLAPRPRSAPDAPLVLRPPRRVRSEGGAARASPRARRGKRAPGARLWASPVWLGTSALDAALRVSAAPRRGKNAIALDAALVLPPARRGKSALDAALAFPPARRGKSALDAALLPVLPRQAKSDLDVALASMPPLRRATSVPGAVPALRRRSALDAALASPPPARWGMSAPAEGPAASPPVQRQQPPRTARAARCGPMRV